jgi:hypothetical protein
MTRPKRLYILLTLLALTLAIIPFNAHLRGLLRPLLGQGTRKTVADRLAEYGPAARARLKPAFDKAKLPYPPARLVLVGVKDKAVLELYAAPNDGALRFLTRYPILAASGGPGPKLREGDGQVPEGLYRIESLNPNSLYHLSLRVNYPNAFDRAMAKRDRRTNLGGDIMIHGGDASIGCLAMGDPASEDLFVLAADTGLSKIQLILTPTDFRKPNATASMPNAPTWLKELYTAIKAELKKVPAPK